MKTKRSDNHQLHQQKENLESDKISQIKQLMKDSCEEFHSVEHLCEQIGVTYHTFRKGFRRSEGVSLSKFMQRCRLQKAVELISNRDIFMFEVADKMGFSSDGNFSRWLKERMGISPTEFKNQAHQKI